MPPARSQGKTSGEFGGPLQFPQRYSVLTRLLHCVQNFVSCVSDLETLRNRLSGRYSHDRIEIALASMSYRPSPTVPLPQRFSVFISPMHGVQKFTFCVSDFDSLSHCLLGRYSRFTLNNYLSLYYQLIHPILLRNLFECARQYSALYREPYCSQQRQQCEYNLRLRYKD